MELIEQRCDVEGGQGVVPTWAACDEVGHVSGVQQDDVVGSCGVECPKNGQVLGSLLGNGEREETETIFLHERVHDSLPRVLA